MLSFKPIEYKIKAKTKTTAKAGAEILLERGVTKCHIYIKSNQITLSETAAGMKKLLLYY